MNNSYRLWNLWDMLEKYGVLVSSLMAFLSQHTQQLHVCVIDEQSRLFGSDLKARKLKIDDDDVTQVNSYLPQIERLAEELELELTAISAARIRSAISDPDYPKCWLVVRVEELQNRLHDELSSRQFLFVSSRFAKYYKQPALFGPEVNDCFSGAVDDIKDAGTALATGLGTSCVMHLMRVLELALKTLAAQLDIPFAVSWEAYLEKIGRNIAAKRTDKTSEWLAVEKHYRDLNGDLIAIKQAWRNPVMHIERRFNVEEAEEVLVAVKTFMQRMSCHREP